MQKFPSSLEHGVNGCSQVRYCCPIGNEAIQRKSFKTVSTSEYNTDVFMFVYDLA